MSKKPFDIPKEGDRVKLRGREPTGIISNINSTNNWTKVKWDDKGPLICHLYELERI